MHSNMPSLRFSIRTKPPITLTDPFDRLPDAVIVHIFSKLCDVKSLGICLSVSKRFQMLVAEAEHVIMKVETMLIPSDQLVSNNNSRFITKKGSKWPHIFHLLNGFGIFKQYLKKKQSLVSPHEYPHAQFCSPRHVLKSFKSLRTLRIYLPRSELGIDKDVQLKWNASFGSTLESCVILAYMQTGIHCCSNNISKTCSNITNTSCTCNNISNGSTAAIRNDGNMDLDYSDHGQSCTLISNDGLKLRVLWTISSLIAASARHYLVQDQIIDEHHVLESLIFADANGQGTLTMNTQQLQQCRSDHKANKVCNMSSRTQLPALTMKLQYTPLIQLPSGAVVKGATLITLRPSSSGAKETLSSTIFEEPYKSLMEFLIKRQAYTLEMNSF